MHYASTFLKKAKSFSRQWRIGLRLSLFQVAIGYKSANAIKALAGGWSAASSACLTLPLYSHTSSPRREGSKYYFHEHRRLAAEEKRTYIYAQTFGILNAYEPIIFVKS